MKWLLTAPNAESPVFHNYLQWVRTAGIAADVIRPFQPLPLAEEHDALLLTGGADIDPGRYGQAPHPLTVDLEPERDDMEFRLLEQFLRSRRAVLGICRGLQLVQVFLGGKLIQHIPDRVAPEKERHSRRGNEDSTHPVIWQPGCPLGEAIGGLVAESNSAHHQAAEPTAIGEGLAVAATSAQGIIEALERTADDGSFVSCVQWHPERLQPGHSAGGKLRDYWVDQVRRRGEVVRHA